jgi:biopolymer transport protein ExbB/biopolymer transport protein TolQ
LLDNADAVIDALPAQMGRHESPSGVWFRRDNAASESSRSVSTITLSIYSRLSQNQKRRWNLDGRVRPVRILASGLFILLLVMYGLRWWSRFDIPLERYVQAVYILLFLMAVFLIGVMIERSLRYWAAHNQTRTFVRELAGVSLDRNLDLAMAIAGRYRRSPSARVVASGLACFLAERPFLTVEEVLGTTQRAMKRSAGVIHGELRRGLNLLASVGSTAPLVGAFGTVLGIVDSFRGCSGARSTCMAYTAEGISDALLLTALSLILGILTMWCYRYLTSELETFDREMKDESAKFVNHLIIHLEQQR